MTKKKVPAVPPAAVPSNSHSLRERAMLVTLTLSKWNGRSADSETTQEILQKKSANSDAGRFAKYLVPRESLGRVASAFSAARSTFRKLTLPWDDGVGILKADNFMAFQERMAELQKNCTTASTEFAEAIYPALLEGAPKRLGKLYKAEDFPDPSVILEKFGFRLTVLPIPDKGDFRVDLGSEAIAGIQQDIEKHVSEKMKSAQKDLWARVLDVMAHFAEVMKDPKAKFKDATIHNLADVANQVRELAVTADPQLEEVCKDLQKMAAASIPDTLRENKALRKETAEEAAKTVERIERIMAGAF